MNMRRGESMKYDPLKKPSHNRSPKSPKPMETWFVELPFDNSDDKKKRPGIVVKENNGMFDVVMITSSGAHSEKDFTIMDTEYAGLDHDSTVRLGKIYKVSASKFDHKLGELSEYDVEELMDKIKL